MTPLFALLAIFSAEASASSPITLCAGVKSCLGDFATIRDLSADISGIIREYERQLLESWETWEIQRHDPSEQELEKQTLALQDLLDRCHESVESHCAVNLGILNKLLDEKIEYLSAPGVKPEFPWNQENKNLYRGALVQKVCTRNTRLETIQLLDRIIFFNTRVYDPALYGEPASAELPNNLPDAFISTHNANNGEVKRYLVALSSIKDKASTSDTGASLAFDDVMTHEFVHAQRKLNFKFKTESDRFLKLRFSKLKDAFEQKHFEVNNAIRKDLDSLRDNRAMTAEEKNKKFREKLTQSFNGFNEWMAKNKIPMRYGPSVGGSLWKNGDPLIASRKSVDVHVDYFGPNNPKILQVSGQNDFYSMENEEEYLAVALSMYRYDRALALKTYSKEELHWLAKNWELGYR